MGKYNHLDRDALVRLLERRDAERQPGLVWKCDELDAEFALNEGFVALEHDDDGLFPDFVLSIHDRQTPGSVALLGVKRQHRRGHDKEPAKAEAAHYGRAFVTGHRRCENTFLMLRERDGKLNSDGDFSPGRLKWM